MALGVEASIRNAGSDGREVIGSTMATGTGFVRRTRPTRRRFLRCALGAGAALLAAGSGVARAEVRGLCPHPATVRASGFDRSLGHRPSRTSASPGVRSSFSPSRWKRGTGLTISKETMRTEVLRIDEE